MFDTLYYTGQYIGSGLLKLPQKPQEAKNDTIKQCTINMDYDHVEFGRPINNEINIDQKSASAIIRCIPYTVASIDWDNSEVLNFLNEIKQKGSKE